ncbi:hypothetical protein K438DRAFT_1992501 [Mycena galopus ATCC 62051]|nr:hypothetical protein K438DRAFT_1992501 [Mycena galopus ATCC 62051]
MELRQLRYLHLSVLSVTFLAGPSGYLEASSSICLFWPVQHAIVCYNGSTFTHSATQHISTPTLLARPLPPPTEADLDSAQFLSFVPSFSLPIAFSPVLFSNGGQLLQAFRFAMLVEAQRDARFNFSWNWQCPRDAKRAPYGDWLATKIAAAATLARPRLPAVI